MIEIVTLEIWMGKVTEAGMVFGIVIYAAITLEFRDENQIKTKKCSGSNIGPLEPVPG